MILEPINAEWRGMALMVHGLNFKPERMLPLATELRHMGIGVLNGDLTGHGDHYRAHEGQDAADARLATYQSVTMGQWLADVAALYAAAEEVARARNVPLFFVGYSMGALMTCTAWSLQESMHFARMVLFAPALAIHAYCYLPTLLRRWPRLLIHSYAPASYRAHHASPVAAYLAIQQAQMLFRQHVDQRINVPTQIFMAPRDELISRRKLRRIIHDHALSEWQLDVVSKRNAASGAGYHHLVVDEASVGNAEWRRMMKKTEQLLLGKRAS